MIKMINMIRPRLRSATGFDYKTKRKVSSLRDFDIGLALRYRGLKPPVNKVTSLRDFLRNLILIF